MSNYKRQRSFSETSWYEKTCGSYGWRSVQRSRSFILALAGKKNYWNWSQRPVGWLVSDGYSSIEPIKNDKCLAHLIRKAIALSGAVNEQARRMGDWHAARIKGADHLETMAEAGGERSMKPTPSWLASNVASAFRERQGTCQIRALAREILNDWEAVIAFVKQGLPPTNNEAERALRHAVISRRISLALAPQKEVWPTVIC